MDKDSLILEQIELEKRMTQLSIDNYRKELEKNKQNGTFSCCSVATKLISRILDVYKTAITTYLSDYGIGKPIRSTIAATVIDRLKDVDTVAYIVSKVLLNSMWTKATTQIIYKGVGQALEDEFKMRAYKDENTHYYTSIQTDLNKRGAKANRKKNITTGVFAKRLDFHLDRWTPTEKFQAGMVLTKLFIESTGLLEYVERYEKNKHYRTIVPTQELVEWIESSNEKLEVMQPFFLPMVCPPRDWTGVLEGGYISPYLKKNKLIKNNNKEYLKKLSKANMPVVYEAINHIQATPWQINKQVLEVVAQLWEEGRAIAELPDREDEPMIPYPYPDKDTKLDSYTEEEKLIIKKWKRDTYDIHKRNVQKRSIRILTAQILRIAKQFSKYDNIYFPYQMDFRGRLYPIPVLLQPQGSDLAKGLLQFAEGKEVDEKSIEWLEIHGANVYGYDKESYEKRIEWTRKKKEEIQAYAQAPLENRGWAEADKPFQFLAFCFEYNDYLSNPEYFRTYLPVQLDGTCNGLQHYSALLRDSVGGTAVNLTDAEKPNDIYARVADKLEEKLNAIKRLNDSDTTLYTGLYSNRSSFTNNINSNDLHLASAWLELGINRKLTKRPVMVLPYGGTILACREYIGEYLTDNYNSTFIWSHFKIGDNSTDCTYKVSVWLSKLLWQSIQETLKAATVGMDYLRQVSRILTKQKKPIEWLTPAGLLVRQAYPTRKHKEVKTELYGSVMKVNVNIDNEEELDRQRQVNGICPNFIHSLDAACLMLYILKCKQAGINCIMSVHDCYGTLAPDTELSAKFLREAFVEIYRQPVLENFTTDVLIDCGEVEVPDIPEKGELDIEEVLVSKYFFN